MQRTPWPAAAIQDTMAAIIRQPAYERNLRTTLLQRLMEWLAALIRRVFTAASEVPHAKWIILGLAVVVIVAIAARIVLGTEIEARRRALRAGVIAGTSDPLGEAERLAAAGAYTDAAHLLYRAVIERLAAAGLVALHPSKTSGDYARELRQRHADHHAEFRRFGRRYEHVIFGVGSCDAETYGVLRREAASLLAPSRERAA